MYSMIYLVFASIYTPTLIFSYPIVVFHFPVANILLFSSAVYFLGIFFRINFEKGVKEFNLRSQLLIIYILNFRKFRSYRSVRLKLPKRRR